MPKITPLILLHEVILTNFHQTTPTISFFVFHTTNLISFFLFTIIILLPTRPITKPPTLPSRYLKIPVTPLTFAINIYFPCSHWDKSTDFIPYTQAYSHIFTQNAPPNSHFKPYPAYHTMQEQNSKRVHSRVLYAQGSIKNNGGYFLHI